MPFAAKFILVMLLMGLADVCWTMYFVYVSAKDAAKAAHWGASIMVCGMISTIFYVEDHALGVASVVGSWIGTYLTVKYIGPWLLKKFQKKEV